MHLREHKNMFSFLLHYKKRYNKQENKKYE